MIMRCGVISRPVSRQRLGKRVLAATVTHATGEIGCSLSGPRREVIKKEMEQPG
jgi:hypothetical protein